MPAAPRLRLNLVAHPVSGLSFSLTRHLLIHTYVRMIQVVACLHANVFDLRPVALELMVRAIVKAYRARLPIRGSLLMDISSAIVVRRLVIIVHPALCSHSRLECGSTLAIQLAQRILPANLAS